MTQEPDAAFSKMLRTIGGTVVHMSAGYCIGWSYILGKRKYKK
jgi:ammonia channel protein AmtB